jgi:ABC-type lipoprotein release transport system permease subunit
VIGGLILGGLVTAWVGSIGLTIPAAQGVTGILIGDKIYPFVTVSDVISLALTAYVITLLASLYPATLAARMEPVEALHAQ